MVVNLPRVELFLIGKIDRSIRRNMVRVVESRLKSLAVMCRLSFISGTNNKRRILEKSNVGLCTKRDCA